MSTEASKAVLRDLIERIINRRELAAADELFAADVVDHSPPPGVPAGLEGVRQTFALMQRAYPDWQTTIEDLIAEGDRAVARVTHRGTHAGDFFGIPPTGRRVQWTATHVVRVADGKVTEHWATEDNLGLLQQLGAIPGGDGMQGEGGR